MEVFWICVAIAVVVFGVMIYALVKFRHSQGAVPDTTLVHSTKVEIIWTVIPVIILVAMAIPAARVILFMEDTRNSELSIRVTAYQWKWQYQYMDAGEGVNFFSTLARDSNFARQLHSGIDPKTVPNYLLEVDHPMVIPSGTKVRLLLTSQDVIHAWWVPDFGAKRSAIPGFVNELWFRVDPGKEGIYRGSVRRALRARPWLHAHCRGCAHARRFQEMGARAEGGGEAGGSAGRTAGGSLRARDRASIVDSSQLVSQSQESLSTMAHAHLSDTAHHDDHHDQPATGIKRWLFATNHKDIGTMYLVFSLIMFFIGGAMAMVIRAELFQAGPATRRSGVLQSDDHQSCADHDLRRRHAGLRRPRQLDDPDANRRARHGAAAHEQFQLLDSAVRVHFAALHPVRAGWHGGRRLDPVSAPGPCRRGDSFPMLIFAIHMMGASSIMGAINVIVTIMNMRAPGMTL